MNKKVIIILISFFLVFAGFSFYPHAEEERQFRFAVIGCMHLGTSNPEDYELAVKKIKQYNPDFVLFLGGMIDASGDKPVESLWQKFDKITERLGVPVYDIASDTSDCLKPKSSAVPNDKIASMEKSFLDRYKKSYYAFEHKNNLFICLDSRKGAGLDEKQLDFLKKTLSNTSNYDNVFLAIHKSFWIPDFTDYEEWYDAVHEPLIKEKVKYVFGSGTHAFNLKKMDNVNYISSGGAPGLLISNTASFFHFLLADVNKDKVSIKAIPILEDTQPIPIENLVTYEVRKSGWVLRQSSYEKKTVLQINQVLKILDIKPDMTILDIGAGSGLFTFSFAEALKGTGMVFATDIQQFKLKYIKEKIEESKYKNIFPVLVTSEGLDPFYKQHSFDIIFLSNVYRHLCIYKDYFTELRPSLLKKTGRLYIMNPRIDVGFNEELDFINFKKIIETITYKHKDFPVFQRLDENVRNFIENWENEEISSEIRKNIVRNFNDILSDKSFYIEISNYYKIIINTSLGVLPILKIIDLSDCELAKWLILYLDNEGTLDKKEKDISYIEKTAIRVLNRIILVGIFKDGLRREQIFLPGFPRPYHVWTGKKILY